MQSRGKSPPTINWQAIRDEEDERQEGFRRIGEFIFWFSQLEFTIKARLERALSLPDQLAEAVTTPYDFAVLCTVTQNLPQEAKSPDHQQPLTAFTTHNRRSAFGRGNRSSCP